MKIKSLHILVCLLLYAVACRESYPLPDSHRNLNRLVVEGHLNHGGETIIRISRVVSIEDPALIRPEGGAQVVVSDGSSNTFVFSENAIGEYTFSQLTLDRSEYRLHITTRDGKEYISDLIPVKHAPEIDSVSWEKGDEGVEIFVNTHDPQNNSRYYRWEYEETWAFMSQYISLFEYKNFSMIPRADPMSIFNCWSNEKSTRIITGSSAKLSDDVIFRLPVTKVRPGSIKISERYSILLRQFVLTPEAYTYWNVLKNNTEQLGTLFDPQPSELKSNIHSVTNPAEQVVGYISAGKISEKRIFINRAEVQPWRDLRDCHEFPVPLDSLSFYFQESNRYLPTVEWRVMGTLLGFYGSTVACVDCTSMGTNVKPSFW